MPRQDDRPPWERSRSQLLVNISTEARDRLKRVSTKSGIPMWYFVETLLLTFSEAELLDLVRRAQEVDGAARAAWTRGR